MLGYGVPCHFKIWKRNVIPISSQKTHLIRKTIERWWVKESSGASNSAKEERERDEACEK